MIGPVGITALFLVSCLSSFYIGYRWGFKVIDNFKSPISSGFIFPGQKWRVPRVGEVIIYDVWPETVSYYLVKSRAGVEKTVYTMNRSDFEEGARDEEGRDGRGNFRTPDEKKVIKFEIVGGGR